MRKLVVIAIFTIPTFFLFLGLNLWVNTLPNSMDLSFDESTTKYSLLKGKFGLIISDESPNKTLHISSLLDQSTVNLSSSELFESNSNQIIKANDVQFNNSAVLEIKNISSGPNNIKIFVKSNEVGLFHGTFNIFSGNSTYIPIAVDIKPEFVKIAMTVANGLAASIVALNVIGYLLLNRRQEQTKKALIEFLKLAYLADPQIQVLQPVQRQSLARSPSLNSVITALKESRPNSAYKELTNLRRAHSGIYRQQNVNNIRQREAQNSLMQMVPNQDQNNHNEILALINCPETDFSLKKYTTTSVIEKNIVAGITGVAFGIVVGFIPLIQSDYINNLRYIEFSDIIILFGMGIGIGNLNEAISKIWEKSKESE